MMRFEGTYSMKLPFEWLITSQSLGNGIGGADELWSRIKNNLPSGCNTKYYCITGQDGPGKTILQDYLAAHLAVRGNCVITAKSPCDKHPVNMYQLKGHCDYFICQCDKLDQCMLGDTRMKKSFEESYAVQQSECLCKFDAYIHLNNGEDKNSQAFLDAKHFYLDTTNRTVDKFLKTVLAWVEKLE